MNLVQSVIAFLIVAAAGSEPSKAGRPKTYEYSETWLCSRAGGSRSKAAAPTATAASSSTAPTDEHDDPGKDDGSTPDPKKRRPNRYHPSILCQCKARFIIRKPLNSSEVTIEYYAHHNHETGTMDAKAHEKLPKRVRDWIEGKVGEGLDWAAMKELIRLDTSLLNAVRVQHRVIFDFFSDLSYSSLYVA